MPPLRQQRGGGGNVGVIEGHRPVAHDAPPPEGVSLGEKVVVFHALPGVQPLQVRLVGHAAVDEEVVGGEQDLRHGLQEGQLRAEAGPHHLPQSGQLLRPPGLEAGGVPHLHQQTAVPPHVHIVAVEPLLLPSRGHKLAHQVVAVAPQAVHRVPLRQLHDEPEGGEAVRPLLHQVAHQHQDVIGAVMGGGQHALEKRQIAVDVADGQHPPPLREGQALYRCCSRHRYTSLYHALFYHRGRKNAIAPFPRFPPRAAPKPGRSPPRGTPEAPCPGTGPAPGPGPPWPPCPGGWWARPAGESCRAAG